MDEPMKLTATVYGDGSPEATRRREDPHKETFEITEAEAFELIQSVEPTPDYPSDDEPPRAA